MGLDLNMFEGEVPQDLLCAFCGRVLVHPETSSCQHVFCGSCLRAHSASECPVCGTKLEVTSQPAPAQIRLRLLELKIRCDHRCGQVIPLGRLPEHVTSQCPNTPVPCEFVSKGCHKTVRRCQLTEHTDECDFRPVTCEACGHQTLFKDLYMHQNRARCVEARIKRQLIQAVRSTRKEVKRHQNHLERQQVRLEQHMRRIEVDHHRRMVTAQRQRLRQQNYNLSDGQDNSPQQSSGSSVDGTHTELALNGLINMSARLSHVPHIRLLSSRENSPHAIPGTTLSRHERGHPATHRVTFSREKSNMSSKLSPRIISTSRENSNPNMPVGLVSTSLNTPADHLLKLADHDDKSGHTHIRFTLSREKSGSKEDGGSHQTELFLTSTHENDAPDQDSEVHSKDAHRCKNCKRQFRLCSNKPNSCRWHAGPIIELFGGTCYTCGRLDYQNGCMMGFHEV